MRHARAVLQEAGQAFTVGFRLFRLRTEPQQLLRAVGRGDELPGSVEQHAPAPVHIKERVVESVRLKGGFRARSILAEQGAVHELVEYVPRAEFAADVIIRAEPPYGAAAAVFYEIASLPDDKLVIA